MNDTFSDKWFYGNASTNTKEFNGLATRYNAIAGSDVADQIIDAGGTGTDNHSIWFVANGERGVRGLYPKGTKGGLMHSDMTNAVGDGADGFPKGTTLYDDNNNPFVGYLDHFSWNMGQSIADKRFVVRIANIDISDLSKNYATGAHLEDLMIQAEERMHRLGLSGLNYCWYAPRVLHTWLRRQMLNDKKTFMSWEKIGGKPVQMWNGTPIKRVDALNVQEARVV